MHKLLLFLSIVLLFACTAPASEAQTAPVRPIQTRPGSPLQMTFQPPSLPFQSTESLSPLQKEELVIVGRLVYISTSPACGFIHFGAVAEYTDLRVIQGRYTRDTLYVVHGCPELPRQEYSAGSGTLEEFKAGDYHVMHLTLENVTLIGTVVATGKLKPLYDVCKDEACSAEAFVRRQNGSMYFCSQVDLYEK